MGQGNPMDESDKIRRLAWWLALAAATVGALVLIGWLFDLPALKSLSPHLIAMKANTALAILLGGMALCLLQGAHPSEKRRRIALILSGLVSLIAALTLSEYVFVKNLGIDQFLVKEPAHAVGTVIPGRMAPNTALYFLLLGLALLTQKQLGRLSQALSATALSIALLAASGYLYGVTSLTGMAAYTRMAPNTALVFLLIAASALLLRTDTGFISLLLSKNLGGTLTRQLLPFAITVPMVIGYLKVHVERQGMLSNASGSAFVTLANTLFFTTLIWLSGRSLSRLDETLRSSEAAHRDHLEEQIRERTAQLTKALQVKSDFTNMVAHELKVPLTVIKASTSIIREGMTGSVNEEQQKILETIARNVDRQSRLIDAVLNVHRLESGQMAFDMKEGDISAVIAEVRQTMRTLAQDKGLNILLQLEDALPKVRFDGDKIVEVLMNLLSNAIEATSAGAITISANRTSDTLQISVKDTGRGIKPEDTPKLFRQFTQLEKKAGGTGLGLAISKMLIEGHGGKLWAESRFGEGTTFHFTLPLTSA